MLGILRIPEISLETHVRRDISARKCFGALAPHEYPPRRNSRKFSTVSHFRTWIFDEAYKASYNGHNSALITALTREFATPNGPRRKMARGVKRTAVTRAQ